MYDKAVSVFSDDEEEELRPNYNILDVWIGNAEFDTSNLMKAKLFSDDVGHEL